MKVNPKQNVLAAMICITMIECVAIMQGMNGLMLTIAVAAVAGLGGYELDDILKILRGKGNSGNNNAPITD